MITGLYKKTLTVAILITALMVFLTCNSTSANIQDAPLWVNNLERAFPSSEWIAVTASGTSQPQAESAAMNMLVRAFRTSVESITQSSLQFSQIIDNSSGSRNITFTESKDFSQDVRITSNVQGLIGVQIDIFRTTSGTVYVNARMNRRECSARYSAMVRENSNIINTLLTQAAAIPAQNSFEVYSRLNFAYAVAQVTDNFQYILEVLDLSAVSRKPAYGGAAAIRARMLQCASLITIGIELNQGSSLATAERILLTRAVGSFFRDLGFRVNEQQGQGTYILRANIRFEPITQNVMSCRYFIDTALTNQNGITVFSFTEDDRRAHPNSAPEARRLAVQAAETSLKEGKFANEFNSWLKSFVY
jgi:hypothetical protein